MKNDYEIRDGYAVIFLDTLMGTRVESFVSLEDIPKLWAFPGRFYSNYHPKTGTYYVAGQVKRGGVRLYTVKLHRYLLDAPRDMLVDHKNGDTLDNRRCNLRLVTYYENAQNRVFTKQTVSGHRNVKYVRKTGKWQVCGKAYGVLRYGGTYETLEEAIFEAHLFRAKHMPCVERCQTINGTVV